MKTTVILPISLLEFAKVKKSSCKTKRNKACDQNTHYLGAFKLEFEKTIAIFEISTIEILKMQSFVQKENSQIWVQKCLFLGVMCNLEKLLSYLKSYLSKIKILTYD